MKTQEVQFGGNNYPCRVVESNEGEELLIGSITLLDALQPGSFNDENEGFASKEAERIYDEVFFFTDMANLRLTDVELVAELKKDLVIDGKKVNAILKDIQFHPVKDTILHVDFYQIDEAKPIVMEVPVQLEGLAEGVKAGGKLVLQMRKLKVKALYNIIPEKLTVNVSHLGLGKTVKVGELNYEGLELLNAKDAVVCAVKLTRAARGAAATAGK